MTDARTSRENVEVALIVDPDARISREHVEATIFITPTAQTSREMVELVYQSIAPANISREHIEILFQAQAPAVTSREHVEILWQYQSPMNIFAERVEVLHTVDPDAQISAESVEILYQEQAPIAISREVLEILYITPVIEEIFDGITWSPLPLETGVEKGVLYSNGSAIPWNGLISVEEKSPGGELATYFHDGVAYYVEASIEDFALSVEAYTYPEVFVEQSLYGYGLVTGQPRRPFDLSYVQENYLHLVWNCMTASPSRSLRTLQQDSDISVFMWEVATRPMPIPGAKPSSHMVIDLETVDSAALTELETLLYDSTAVLPTPEEILAIFEP